MFNLKISKNINNKYNIIQTHLQYKRSLHLDKSLWQVYDKKLENNISRGKSQIFNIVQYNNFKYFYTQTISSLYNRTDIKLLINKFSQITRDLRKLYPSLDFYYLLIPEYHSDSTSFHLHGLLSPAYSVCVDENENGFLELKKFNKLRL